MALINGIYVFIDEDGERVEQEYELSSHPVEDGEAVADHLRPQPFVIKLQGEVVGPDAAQKLAKLRQLAATATPVTYAGRNYDKNMLITRFDTGHPGSVMAGLTFEMELRPGGLPEIPMLASPPTRGKTPGRSRFRKTVRRKKSIIL